MQSIIIHFTDRFPAINQPVYCETRNDNGHIDYWNTFESVSEMKSFIEKLFFNYRIVYKDMR